MPLLTTFDLGADVTSLHLNLKYAKCILTLPNLPTFKVKGHLVGQVFHQLATLSDLRDVRAVSDGGGRPQKTELPSNLSMDTFHNLQHLQLTTSISNLSPMLESGIRFRSLETLWLGAPRFCSGETTADEFRTFASLLAGTATTIRNIHLDMEAFDWQEPMNVPTMRRISIEDIAPLFILRTIRQFHLTHTYTFLLHNDDLAILRDSWPMLECLMLNHEPFTLEEPILTLDVLAVIAQHSPWLRKLAISINTGVRSASLHSHVVMTRLTDLWMGVSTIERGKIWLDHAAFLSHVLPRTTRIRTAGAWWYEIAGMEDDNARMWRRVILLTCVMHEAKRLTEI
jgi:hypothetical protein